MRHLTEEELVGRYYDARGGESEPNAAAALHLDTCPECAEAYAALENDVAEMRFAEPPARNAAYGERVWAQLAGSLTAYENRKWSWLRGSVWRGLGYAAACAVLVACAFIGGRLWERREVAGGTETYRCRQR